MPQALRVVVMGVSGCGKSALGKRLAAALDLPFVEGDELHPPRNVERMAAGIALTDADRAGWLQAVAGKLAQAKVAGLGLIISCSALKRSYRDVLRSGSDDTCFILLHGDVKLLAERMARRAGHYMPASLLPSQLAALELPLPDEGVLSFDIGWPLQRTVNAALEQLKGPKQ